MVQYALNFDEFTFVGVIPLAHSSVQTVRAAFGDTVGVGLFRMTH